MSLGLLAPAMLWGMLGVSIPVIIHLLNRRRVTTVDWGAMQFLELGRRARRKFRLTELLLMAGRMALLGLVALAVARPFWRPSPIHADAGQGGASGQRRDVVLVLDGSASMDRKAGGTTPRALALQWARRFVAGLTTGDSVAVLVAKDRVRPLVDPPSFDKGRVDEALQRVPDSRGSSDLPAALGEAFRILETAKNPGRDVIVLTDGQRLAWRPGEATRWALLKELRKQMASPPRLWSIAFGAGERSDGVDVSVGPLELARGLVPPRLTFTVRTSIANAGPGSASRTAELLVDGVAVPGTAQAVGPIPPGGQVPVSFPTAIAEPGSHALSVRLVTGDDPLASNDEAARAVDVAAALPVLLVDGEPGREPLSGETDFLRAALSPAEDETRQVEAKTIRVEDFTSESLTDRRVLVLANVARLGPAQAAAVAEFLESGGGVLIAPGDRVDEDFYNQVLFQEGGGWLPARLGEGRGDPTRRSAVAHPAPRSFNGPALAPFGQGEAPPLGDADLFSFRVLQPATRVPPAAVTARLDTGDPWVVERPYRKGRVVLLAGPVDAEGGTLPVNPDFVPYVHELMFHLADPGPGARAYRPGEPIILDLAPTPPVDLNALDVLRPDGTRGQAVITRSGRLAQARFDDTIDPGLYRFARPGGLPTFVAVAGEPRESDPEPLAPAEATKLAEGWPLEFEDDPVRLSRRVLATGTGSPRPFWRGLVVAALVGLCLEVWLTRRLARERGLADLGGTDS